MTTSTKGLILCVSMLVVYFVVNSACRAEVAIAWSIVADPGNAPDETKFGSVANVFRIGKFEVTNEQYSEFLNAVAADDPHGLFNARMDVNNGPLGGISQNGNPGRFSYAVQEGRGDKPVVWVSFWDSVRFANWLNNGQPKGGQDATTTEDGAYTITTEGFANNSIERNPGATVFLPSEDEWYKATYYRAGGKDSGYWQYPFGTDEPTAAAIPPGEPNTANIESEIGDLTDVGAYSSSLSPYGSFDLGGNAWEWNEDIFIDEVGGSFRRVRGGSWNDNFRHVQATVAFFQNPEFENLNLGFRVASVPEPKSFAFASFGLLFLALIRKRT